jgi:hypothetical protein
MTLHEDNRENCVLIKCTAVTEQRSVNLYKTYKSMLLVPRDEHEVAHILGGTDD